MDTPKALCKNCDTYVEPVCDYCRGLEEGQTFVILQEPYGPGQGGLIWGLYSTEELAKEALRNIFTVQKAVQYEKQFTVEKWTPNKHMYGIDLATKLPRS